MKRILAFALVLCMILVFASCKEDKPAFGNDPVVDISKVEEIKVGIIYSGGTQPDNAYVNSHIHGIKSMQFSLGMSDSQIVQKYDIPVNDPSAVRTALTECAEEGCKIVFCTEKEYASAARKAADKYPDVIFSVALGEVNNGANLNSYSGLLYQAQYVDGVCAGYRTASKRIGFVGAVSDENYMAGLNAFARGVERINPDAVVYVREIESQYDYSAEYAAAQSLIDLGCDVIAQNTYSAAPQQAAADAEVWSCGYLMDLFDYAPTAHLVAPVVNWGQYYTKAVKDTMEGEWENLDYTGSLADGFVAVSNVNHNCRRGTSKSMREASAQVISGTDVFVGEMMDNKGNKVCEEGLAIADVRNISWYYRNVKVNVDHISETAERWYGFVSSDEEEAEEAEELE